MKFPKVSYLDTAIKMIQKYYYDNATDTDTNWSDDSYNMYQYCFPCLKGTSAVQLLFDILLED